MIGSVVMTGLILFPCVGGQGVSLGRSGKTLAWQQGNGTSHPLGRGDEHVGHIQTVLQSQPAGCGHPALNTLPQGEVVGMDARGFV